MTRSNAREVAVHLIYEIDYTGEDPAQAIETRMDRSYYSGLSAENDVYAERPSKKQMDYIRTCVTGVCEHAEELDALIAQYAVRWNLHRISRLTKAAMRLAIYEMRYVDDVPNGVAINECVELTRKYEDAQVVSFVNGILGSVARGVCEVQNGMLMGITERTKIYQRGDHAAYTEDGEHFVDLPGDTIVSMNIWGFTQPTVSEFWTRLGAFFEKEVPLDPLKREFYLPSVVNQQLEEGTARVRVLPCEEVWHGVTYREDLASVKEAICALKAAGVYEERLWPD